MLMTDMVVNLCSAEFKARSDRTKPHNERSKPCSDRLERSPECWFGLEIGFLTAQPVG